LRRISKAVVLKHAVITFLVENDMVEEGNADDFPGLFDLLGYLNVGLRGFEVAFGVIV
jgi:hypothetical protein